MNFIHRLDNANGVKSFSPALADEIGLRRVNRQTKIKTLKGFYQSGGNRFNSFRVDEFVRREPGVVAARQRRAE
jgi:hypothetical protein